MRGYPILNDDLSGRLSELDRRIARLEQPHKINYAKRLRAESYSYGLGLNTVQTINDPQPVTEYIGRIYGPTLMYHVGGQGNFISGGDNMLWELHYAQLWPLKNTVPQIIDSGSIPSTFGYSGFLWPPSIATNEYIFAPTILTWETGPNGLNIEGTFGSLFLLLGNDTFNYMRYKIIDNGFITPEYEHLVP